MSLIQIHDYCAKHNKNFEDLLKNATKKHNYWLGGQIKINIDEQITDKHIEDVNIKNEESLNLYGGACNTWEYHSMWKSRDEFEKLQLIRNEYLTYVKHKKSVQIIEDHWLAYYMNPDNDICKRRLIRELNELTNL